MISNNFKISESDIKETTEDEYQLFLDGFSSDETKKTYIKRIKIFLCVILEDILDGDRELNEKQKLERLARGNKNEIKQFLDADFEARLREFVKKSTNDVKWSKNILYTYAVKQKERITFETTNPDYLNPSTISNIFKPIKKLFKSCGVDFNWTTIENTFPPLTNQDNSRAYTTQEIELGLQHAYIQTRTAMYLYASSSIRRSGISFKWEDLKPIYRKNDKLVMGHYDDSEDSDLVCGMVIIYKGEEEQYFAMFTPET